MRIQQPGAGAQDEAMRPMNSRRQVPSGQDPHWPTSLNQGIAVTGSVNQKGEIQPIGGATHKIEGFFDVCKARKLTGEQGVIIPIQNVKNLHLKDEVIEAVKEGKFHIWPVKTIDEGIEILTGVPAGKRKKDGTYPKGTINAMAYDKLRRYAMTVVNFGKEEAGTKKY